MTDSIRDRLGASRLIRWGLAALGGAIVIGLLGLGGWTWQQARESRAAVALAATAEAVQQALAPGAAAGAVDHAVTALEAVLAEHSGASIAPLTAYRLGNLHYAAGRYAAARGAYEIALGKGAAGSLRHMAALGIGYSWEAQKDYLRAQAGYEAAARGLGPADFLFEELLVDLARVQESGGNHGGALGTYERILKELPDSRRADDIRSRIASLRSVAKP